MTRFKNHILPLVAGLMIFAAAAAAFGEAQVWPSAAHGPSSIAQLTDERAHLSSGASTRAVGVGPALLRTSAPHLQQPSDYVWMGVMHIWGGWDHLAFIACLCLLTKGRRLLLLITTFTLAHSLSMALAFLAIVRAPSAPVEIGIALSIAFMAQQALMTRDQAKPEARRAKQHVAVVAGFGVLHGLGFAEGLSGLRLAGSDRIMGLAGFNLGLELGQLAFVLAITIVIGCVEWMRLLRPTPRAV